MLLEGFKIRYCAVTAAYNFTSEKFDLGILEFIVFKSVNI